MDDSTTTKEATSTAKLLKKEKARVKIPESVSAFINREWFSSPFQKLLTNTKNAEGRLRFNKAKEQLVEKANEMLQKNGYSTIDEKQMHAHIAYRKKCAKEKFDKISNNAKLDLVDQMIVDKCKDSPAFSKLPGGLDSLTIVDSVVDEIATNLQQNDQSNGEILAQIQELRAQVNRVEMKVDLLLKKHQVFHDDGVDALIMQEDEQIYMR